MKISLGTKFQLKLTILVFRTKFAQKGLFPVESGKNENHISRASMVITYYIKLFRMGADRYNGFLMSPLLLVAETIKSLFPCLLIITLFTNVVCSGKLYLISIHLFKFTKDDVVLVFWCLYC